MNNHIIIAVVLAVKNTDSLKLLDLGMEDLLERKKVEPDLKLMEKDIKFQTVLVSGAGGTIGSQLCREILKNNPGLITKFAEDSRPTAKP